MKIETEDSNVEVNSDPKGFLNKKDKVILACLVLGVLTILWLSIAAYLSQ